jgi:NADPH-dependent 2,4-dienoyl-CoA reductase/sulfur reductase-like enzyme/nitrite reductase/ring-hydroxylating ferredoxin subunit
MGEASELSGPDLAAGIAAEALRDGEMLTGHSAGEPVLLVRRGGDIHAVGAKCTHYGGPLGEGLVVGASVRCPWHHACFDLGTGAVLRAPGVRPVDVWDVEREGDRIFVRRKRPSSPPPARSEAPRALILGAGAAGCFAAYTLRAEGFAGSVTLVARETSLPFDKPNLSKDYLAGSAPEDWIPLRSQEDYQANGIDLRLGVEATAIDAARRTVTLARGEPLAYDRLLLATGAEPRRLDIPGADSAAVSYLRTFEDSRRIIERAATARKAVVIGASFIGLEVAGSLRARGLDVTVVGAEQRPLERVFGTALASFIRRLHEQHGVTFRLGRQPTAIEAGAVRLDDGERLAADLVVVGIGVVPSTTLAETAGVEIDRGVRVDEYLQTSREGIYAAGDLARWPYAPAGKGIRVEHWVVAGRQGQTAARNMMGRHERFDAVPFFWSQHYDVTIAYVGYAESAADATVDGSLDAHDATVVYRQDGRVAAVATIFRDRQSLAVEEAMECADRSALERALAPVSGGGVSA